MSRKLTKYYNRTTSFSLLSECRRTISCFWQYLKGCFTYRKIAPAVTVFGSARMQKNTKAYQQAMEIGRLLAENNYTTISGGGPGIMNACSKGAKEAGGLSVGVTISIENESPNTNMHFSQCFKNFFPRKVMLTKYASGFIIFPGGFGTLDETFEILTLIQTKHLEPLPIICINSEFWTPIIDCLNKTFMKYKTIDPEDFDLISITDSPQEAVKILLDYYK